MSKQTNLQVPDDLKILGFILLAMAIFFHAFVYCLNSLSNHFGWQKKANENETLVRVPTKPLNEAHDSSQQIIVSL